ncbi:MAG TPA: SGNH/GDSL hydrolase family protein [Bacteroidia bacterium]|jgi:lysophospholipase L1-like esterase|nr:SGNH/GDSL hydrolase family protein [Bacteroidia bacterium]
MNAKSKKNIDVTRYVALGDSITSGYTDGALCYYGQQNAYPKLIASQFKLFGGGDFKQPLIKPDSVGIGFSGNSRLILKEKFGNQVLSYLKEQGDLSAFSENNYSSQGPFNNMGVPAAKAISLVMPGLGNITNGTGNYNPFFTRMTSDSEHASILSDALVMKPTFFSLFIGSNDVFRFALSGATSDSITPSFGAPGIGFDESIRAIVNALTENGAKGVIANIPDMGSIPFFTAIPYNGLEINHVNTLTLNTKYGQSGLSFQQGKNPFVIYDSTINPPDIRHIKKGEFIICDILLDPDKELFLKGISPIPKKYILTISEIDKIKAAIREYNVIIKTIANEKGLAFVDVNAMMNSTKTRSTYNPEIVGLDHKKRNVFSLDGLHPNALGQALLANEFIKGINLTYSSNIPLVKMIKYKRKILPREHNL